MAWWGVLLYPSLLCRLATPYRREMVWRNFIHGHTKSLYFTANDRMIFSARKPGDSQMKRQFLKAIKNQKYHAKSIRPLWRLGMSAYLMKAKEYNSKSTAHAWRQERSRSWAARQFMRPKTASESQWNNMLLRSHMPTRNKELNAYQIIKNAANYDRARWQQFLHLSWRVKLTMKRAEGTAGRPKGSYTTLSKIIREIEPGKTIDWNYEGEMILEAALRLKKCCVMKTLPVCDEYAKEKPAREGNRCQYYRVQTYQSEIDEASLIVRRECEPSRVMINSV